MFRCYVSFREGEILGDWEFMDGNPNHQGEGDGDGPVLLLTSV